MIRHGGAFTLGRLAGRRALLDDPFAVLSAGWFAERLGCKVIALVRDPVSFVASWQRLGWTVYFHELLEQPLLVRDHPQVLRLRVLVGSQDRVAKAAALWRVTREILARTPGILVTSYDDLAADPRTGFKRLYDYAGLAWTPAAEERVIRACTAPGSRDQGFAWSGLSRTAYRPMDSRAALRSGARGLTQDEIDRVRALTADEGPRPR
jgi:hypothetical protein